MRRLLAILLLLALVASSSVNAGEMTLRFDHYYDSPAVEKALRTLVKKYPKFTELRSLGKSEEGRDIWMLQIHNPKSGVDTSKPGIYVDGAIHGNEVQATEVCLYLASYLLDEYDRRERVRELVDSRTFYIIPVVNVDNRWHFFEDPSNYNSRRSGWVPYDDDHDGLKDEDDYDDLDGDGEILRMRIADPQGDYRTRPDDSRVMVPVKPGEQGQWRLLGLEGIDNDGDGRLNEDPVGYLDMNRNWGFKWQPPYVQSGAGDFPMSGKVTKAISDFILSKPNIVFDFAFHNFGGMLVRGPGSKLSGLYSPSDVRVYDFLGEEGERILPGYRYIEGGKDMYTAHGDFDEWMFSNLGIYGFVGELYMSSQQRFRRTGDEPERDMYESLDAGVSDLEKQEFNDRLEQGEMFRDWHKVIHPEFGEIEIGGWRPFTTRIPQLFQIQEMVHRNASMVLFTAGEAPDVTLELLEATPLGDGLTRVRIRANNRNAIPSLSARNVKNKISRPDVLMLEGRGIEVVSGGIVTSRNPDRVQFVEHRPQLIFTSVPGHGSREVQWIVKGRGKVVVRYDAMKAANRKLEFTL